MVATAAENASPPKVRSVCRQCLEVASSLDFSTSVDVVGPAAGTVPAIVFVHGGGGCRLMYAHHARVLSARGYRCVLLDLPAHGSLVDEALTIESACDRIVSVTRELAPPYAGVAPAYVGGSLGGYIGMELLGRFPDLFCCAVISCASQTVGVGASCKARLALKALNASLGVLYGQFLVQQMMGVVAKRPELMQDLLTEAVFGPSMFFQRGAEHVAVLQQSQPLEALQSFTGPVLFADGSEDHHDNREKLLAVTQSKNSRSRAVVYEVRLRAARGIVSSAIAIALTGRRHRNAFTVLLCSYS